MNDQLNVCVFQFLLRQKDRSPPDGFKGLGVKLENAVDLGDGVSRSRLELLTARETSGR